MSSFLGFYPTKRSDYFFVSYNTEDADRIAPIVIALSQDDVPLWYDYGIDYDEEWEPRIAEKISAAQSVILLFTKGILAKDNSYVRKEFRIAKMRHKKIYIVMLDKIADDNVPNQKMGWWCDITDQQCIPAYDLQPDELLSEIRRALGMESRKKELSTQIERQPLVKDTPENDKYHTKQMQFADEAAKASRPQALAKVKSARLCAENETAETDFKKNATIENGVLKKYNGSAANVSIPNGVTLINTDAFSGCKALTSVTIPESVNYIVDNPFGGCSNLTKITVSANNPNFFVENGHLIDKRTKTLIVGCANTLIPANGSVTSIGKGAFSRCETLATVAIPDGVISIGEYAFSGCKALTSVTIPGSVSQIAGNPFSGCDNLTKITVSANNSHFFVENGHLIDKRTKTLIVGCRAFTSVTIPNGVTSIGKYAFSYCKALTSVTIPNGVISIGENAFSYCKALTSVTIPNSVTSIGMWAFASCHALTSVTIPNRVTAIESFTFWNCTGLTSVAIPNSVTHIKSSAFCNCAALASVVIPNSMTNIGLSAFDKCINLISVTIPGSVTEIGAYAFEKCDKITIFTPQNSFAWKWAEKRHIPVKKMRKLGMNALLPMIGK